MRTATIFMIVAAWLALAALPTASAADDKCEWLPGPGVAPIVNEGEGLRYRRYLQCTGDGGGEFQIRVFSGTNGKMVQQGDKDKKVRPYMDVVGLERRIEKRLEYRAGMQSLCRVEPPKNEPATLFGHGHDQKVGFAVQVRFEFVGQGALQPLNRVDTFEILCPKCPDMKRSGIWLSLNRGQRIRTGGSKITAKLDPAWYACARSQATLQLRFFVTDGERHRFEPIKPVMVVRGLEKKLRKQGGSVVMEVPVNLAPLCRTGKSWVVWEAWGDGELKAAGKGRHSFRLGC